jgi:type I restriction-modification system DNA methylase subunit
MTIQNLNKPLFSSHYLEHRLVDSAEWNLDARPTFEALQQLYQRKKALLSSLNEAQTEEEFIKPVLEILGFSYIAQVVTKTKGRAERPDYALFANDEQKSAAYSNQTNESVFYHQVLAIAEAIYWERSLSKVSSNDQRDFYKNTNPSFQIASYLIGTSVNWGILTNGREWRLYYRLASSTATEFYPIDLVELLEADNVEQFKYFWLFFRREAFEADSQGKNFLERVRDGSATYATTVGNGLKSLVFEEIFARVAGGFVVEINRKGEEINADQVYEATLSFLYKLLFLFYAEARNLLPIDRDYREYSLTAIAQEIAVGINQPTKKWSHRFSKFYDNLITLFQIIDRGDVDLEVPRYNGGLFHFDQNDLLDKFECNYFLNRYQLSDGILAPVIDKLARFEGQAIDYSFLGVRQLGSIYEGLLEYRLVIDNPATGEVHLENDKGDRKASGSYYTPDYIVKYIVSHTLKPILETREQEFKVLMGQISELQQQKNNKRLGLESLRGLDRELEILERRSQTILLDIKVCDPAMGSGHFLVEAVDFLTDELIQILNLYPDHNPILKMLDQMRNSIVENLRSQGIRLDPSRLEPTQLLQRVVMKRCIYGVDLNPMAVELAKVSLWLHSFTIGAPLSFLDHHLRCGNSLIGTTAREAEVAMSQEKKGNAVQFSLLTGPFVGLLRAAEIMRGVSVLSDATFAEVEQSERLFKQFDESAKPFKQLLDVYVSQFFGVKQAKNLLERLGTALINPDLSSMKETDLKVLEDSYRLYKEKHFFHWDLEFPEVFIDLENANWSENPGFDAVIGNPPYGIIFDIRDKNYLENILPAFIRNNDIYTAFSQKCVELTREKGLSSLIIPNTFILGTYFDNLKEFLLNNSNVFSIDNFNDDKVFIDANVFVSIFLIQKDKNGNESITFLRNCLVQNLNIEYLNIFQINLNNLPKSRWLPFDTITERVQSKSVKLESICLVKDVGFNYWSIGRKKTRGDSIGNRILYDGQKQHDQDICFIKGSSFQQYEHPVLDRHWLRYNYEEFLTQNVDIFRFSPEFLQVSQKIIYRQTSDRIVASIDREGSLVDKTVHVILLKDNIIEYSYFYLLTLLNCQIIDFIYKDLSKEEGRLFAQVKTFRIKDLPIRKINFTTESDRRQQGLETLIKLYQTYQTNFDLAPILSQCQQHLNQQPEEADIIHDFLAYLAEQMIQLNQQKQTEIKGFLKWLERFIGCPVDTLKNKSKIQNYLGDYTKQKTLDPALDFDGLITILNQNKKLIKIDPNSRKDQEPIETEYQTSLNTLLPIKTRLKNCDHLIDEIVYQLYGLTPEEKAIIENSLNK